MCYILLREMKIKSKTGYVFEAQVTGLQEKHHIYILPFNAQGRTIEGKAIIGRQSRDDNDRGLYIGKGFIRCSNEELRKIENQIKKLPHRHYYAKKQEEIVSVDGNALSILRWHFDKLMTTAKGTIIMDVEMGAFLDTKKITEIELSEAIQLWSEEKETEHITIEKQGAKYAKAVFDDDELEVGFAQACDNAGLPSFLQ